MKGFMTQTWDIPDRPKPGRKPKEPRTKPTSNISTKTLNVPKAASVNVEKSSKRSSSKTASGMMSQTSVISSLKKSFVVEDTAPQSLQQAYINSLEQKIETLKNHQTEQTLYYKCLASQSNEKLTELENEKNVLKSQAGILRAEVLRLRKRIKQLTDSIQPILIDDPPPEGIGKKTMRKKINEDSLGSDTTRSSSAKRLRDESDLINSDGNQISSDALKINSHVVAPVQKSMSNVGSFSSGLKQLGPNRRIPNFTSNDIDCGLCTSELDCVCRQVGLKPTIPNVQISESDIDSCLAVPILRPPSNSNIKLWTVISEDTQDIAGSPNGKDLENQTKVSMGCSGDPKDCPACRDDDFGRAFCTALRNSTSSLSKEFKETKKSQAKKARSDAVVDAYTTIPCCGEPELCGSQNCFDEPGELNISCSDAWRQLKAHPNIGFANLQLLADVVARKSMNSNDDEEKNFFQKPCSSVNKKSDRNVEEEKESWELSPHNTLSTVFENKNHNPEAQVFLQGGSSQILKESKSDLKPRKVVKYVNKKSLNEAMLMLDRAVA
ncbi:hypothetical protein PPACK8108_LOCUS18533 [Phakopsora pachyrhizi]|uniref:Hap4 transcription factor heteromerisation domain-containing protein n=1 Tax=Phakopsora pachyrhizi TaxID=170000 RepID=A0AAV0BG18_PHAPC|nr:hypothetical protein PPACK8108_LOCUS18533 [Phakopsora pachyrhizi]